MNPLKIGIVREGKIPPDNRTPLTPRQCSELKHHYPGLDVQVEWAAFRCYTDEDFKHFDIMVKESVDNCELLLGIKEVPIDKMVPGKTYMFFSHTAKKQERNRKLLQAILEKKITLIDYEYLTDEHGNRIIGFGRWAGIVGAHYALMMLGKRWGGFSLKPAHQCLNLQELVDQYDSIQFPPARFLITGTGRVANGALEVMVHAGIREVSKEEYLTKEFKEPVYVQLRSQDMYAPLNGGAFDREEFHQHPERYGSTFAPFIPRTDALINCMFWHPLAPRMFSKEDIAKPDFAMKTISDVSCDINGSVPITVKDTFSDDPIYGYHIEGGTLGKPFQPDTIDVMAVSNLPNELPKDASRDFGLVLSEQVIPKFMEDPHDPLFERAAITRDGQLTPRYAYLQDFVEGK